jgi:site-specific DNA-methyltransferase (adenine-specific)
MRKRKVEKRKTKSPGDGQGRAGHGEEMIITKEQLFKHDTKNNDRIELGKFNIILADPSWRFKNWSMKELAERGEKWARRNGRSPYDVMTTEDIAALPVANIAAKNAILMMWATYPKLPDALQVIATWGFEYKTCAFTWVKLNKRGSGFKLGLGYHTRGNCELCLLATKGKGLRRVDNAVPNLLIAPIRDHSQKPDEARDRIERLYGDVPRIELFARQERPGWVALGNEVGECLDLRNSLKMVTE